MPAPSCAAEGSALGHVRDLRSFRKSTLKMLRRSMIKVQLDLVTIEEGSDLKPKALCSLARLLRQTYDNVDAMKYEFDGLECAIGGEQGPT